MDALHSEEGGFDAKCKILFAVGAVTLVAGLVLTLATRTVPRYYVLFAVGVVVVILAWVVCLRETNLVGEDEEAPDEAKPQDEKTESEK